MTNQVLLSRFTPSLMAPETLEKILVQRHDLAADLVETIETSVLTPAKHFRLLIGPRGIGKTHMVTLVYHRVKAAIQANETLGKKLCIAWLREEEWGVASFLDLLIRIFRALAAEYPQEYQEKLSTGVKQLYGLSPREAEHQAKGLLREFVGDRTLLILAENLGDLFDGLGDSGQKDLRAYIQTYNFITILATAQSLFAGVSDRSAAFYGFFRVDYLEPFSFEEVVLMLEQIADLLNDQELVDYLKTPTGQARVKAVHHLAGGNPRIYVIFAQFLTRESLDSLVTAFMETLDELTPYYQSRMGWISPQQRKIVEFLVDVRRTATVKEIAQQCFITHQTASSQIKELVEKGYVILADTIGRESFYELREPLMRFCLEVKKQRGEPIQLFVDFLRIWYERFELEQRYAQLMTQDLPNPKQFLEQTYLSYALNQTKTQIDDPRVAAYWDTLKHLQKEKNWTEALKIAEKLIELRGSAEDWFQKSRILLFAKNYKKALEAIDYSINLYPKSSLAWSNRAAILGNLNRHDEAIESCDRAIDLDQNNFNAWINRGAELLILHRDKEALEASDRAIALDPNDSNAWNNKGASLGNLGCYEKALEAIEKSINLDSNNLTAWICQGLALGKLGFYTESKTSFEHAIRLDPSNFYSWRLRGTALGNSGYYKESLESYNQAIELNSNDIWSWAGRGFVLWKLGYYQEALQNYQKSFYLSINSGDIDRKQILDFLAINLVNTISILVNEIFSLKKVQVVLETWQELAGEYEEFQVVLRLLATAVKYKEAKDEKQRRRVLLSLPEEERRVFESLLDSGFLGNREK